MSVKRLIMYFSRKALKRQIRFTYKCLLRRDIPLHKSLSTLASFDNIFPSETIEWARREIIGYSGSDPESVPSYRFSYGIPEQRSPDDGSWGSPGEEYFSKPDVVYLSDSVADLESGRDASLSVGPYNQTELIRTTREKITQSIIPRGPPVVERSTYVRDYRNRYDYYAFSKVLSSIRNEALDLVEIHSLALGFDLSDERFPILMHSRLDDITAKAIPILRAISGPAKKMITGSLG